MKNKVLTAQLSVLALLFLSGAVNAKNYYVNARIGSDVNNGSAFFPWKSFESLKKITFKEGDKILFSRACTFSGTLSFAQEGPRAPKIILAAYGQGQDPIFNLDQPASTVSIISGGLKPNESMIQIGGSLMLLRNIVLALHR